MEEYLLIPVGLGVSAAGLGVAPVLTLFCTATYKLGRHIYRLMEAFEEQSKKTLKVLMLNYPIVINIIHLPHCHSPHRGFPFVDC